MDPLAWPDNHHVLAAEGWLGLGNARESMAELGRVSSASLRHPAVLSLKWEILAFNHDWELSLEYAEALTRGHPDQPGGWISLSFALHELKRTVEARDHLLRALPRFPSNPTMRYNLACYEAQLGHLDIARHWLDAALALPGSDELRAAAVNDPDLAPLRENSPPGNQPGS